MNNPKAVLFHGIDDDPQDEANYYKWLAGELARKGYDIAIPQMPTGANQTREKWLEASREYFLGLDDRSIVAGRSMGSTLTMLGAERYQRKAKFAALVAPWVGEADLRYPYGRAAGEDADCQSFVADEFNFPLIRSMYEKIIVAHDDNDDVVDPRDHEKVITELGAIDLDVTEKGYGHCKLKQFDELRDAIFKAL